MFHRDLLKLIEFVFVNISYYLIEILMKMYCKHHQQHLENNDIHPFCHSK